MVYRQNRNIIIVCEGASEKAYIQELNRYLEEEDIPLHFIPRPSNGGQYSPVVKKYMEVRKENRAASILIWVDWDRYQRNDNADLDNYRKNPTTSPISSSRTRISKTSFPCTVTGPSWSGGGHLVSAGFTSPPPYIARNTCRRSGCSSEKPMRRETYL